MARRCHLCGRKASKLDRVSLFRIPKEPIARDKWMKVCNFFPYDDLQRVFICSEHFSTNHIDRGNEFQTRCTLKIGAVPSIGVPNPISFNNENIDTLNDGTENNVDKNNVEMAKNCYSIHEPDEIVPHVITLDCVYDNLPAQEVQSPIHPPEEVSFEQSGDLKEQSRLDTADFTKAGEVDENFEKSPGSCSSTSKRRFFEPRWVSEILPTDFKSPKITRRIVNLIKDTDKKKSKLIKSLQDRNRGLQKRISSQQQILAHLKKIHKLSNATGNKLLKPEDEEENLHVDPLQQEISSDPQNQLPFQSQTPELNEFSDSAGCSKAHIYSSSVPQKRMRLTLKKKQEHLINEVRTLMRRKESEVEVFGRSVGEQLKTINPTQLAICQKLISDALFYGKMDQLTLQSSISLAPDLAHPAQMYSAQPQPFPSNPSQPTPPAPRFLLIQNTCSVPQPSSNTPNPCPPDCDHEGSQTQFSKQNSSNESIKKVKLSKIHQ